MIPLFGKASLVKAKADPFLINLKSDSPSWMSFLSWMLIASCRRLNAICSYRAYSGSSGSTFISACSYSAIVISLMKLQN